MMSGPPVHKFTEGWALPMFRATAHYFTRDGLERAVSACGRAEAYAGRMLEVGSWRRCAVCTRRLARAQEGR